MNKQNGHRTQDHRNGSRTRTPPTCTFSSGIALSQPGLHLAASFPEQPPPCCVKARSASEGRPRPHPAPPPHHLVGLHGQLHLVVAVLPALAVGALDPLQVLHALTRRQSLHRGDILCSQDVDLGFLV